MPNMTGRPGYRTMEMIGGSSALYLACAPCVPLFCTSFNRGGNRGAFKNTRGRQGIISIVQWNRRPVIFGVDNCLSKHWVGFDSTPSLWLPRSVCLEHFSGLGSSRPRALCIKFFAKSRGRCNNFLVSELTGSGPIPKNQIYHALRYALR